MSFTLPGLLSWQFRIVLIGQHVVLEASSDSQRLSTILDPTSSRIRRGYDLIQSPQCALINDCPAWWLGSSAWELNMLFYLVKPYIPESAYRSGWRELSSPLASIGSDLLTVMVMFGEPFMWACTARAYLSFPTFIRLYRPIRWDKNHRSRIRAAHHAKEREPQRMSGYCGTGSYPSTAPCQVHKEE
jgi:hypothetical protein